MKRAELRQASLRWEARGQAYKAKPGSWAAFLSYVCLTRAGSLMARAYSRDCR